MQKTGNSRRTNRVTLIKKLIVAFLVLGIAIPILLCILLFIKVSQLQEQVNTLKSESSISTNTSNMRQQANYKSPNRSEVLQMGVDQEKQTSSGISTNDFAMINSDNISSQNLDNDTADDICKVYLTFDDGPSSNTNTILDILDQYDVKAGFFVIGQPQDEYKDVYKRIVNEGHTLGMHSYSHKYNEIYASQEAFTSDLDQLQEFLYKETGIWSRFYRFPGGSSNQVSKVDMNDLTNYLNEQDIYYLDWNVTGGDATGKKITPQKIADNVTNNVLKYHTAVVLLHDASDKTATVEALPIMLEKLKSMDNVQILPVSDDMNMVQHLAEHTGV